MLQQYKQFYQEAGVRRPSELMSPRLQLFRGFPRNSVYHYLTEEEGLLPDPSKSYFHGYSKRLPVELVYQSDFMPGHPRKVPFVPSKFVLPFIRRTKIFKFAQKLLDAGLDDRTLGIVDYNPLKVAYQYVRTPISSLQSWEGGQKTMWATINQQASQSNKEHFVLLNPIKDIPSYSMLTIYGDREEVQTAKLFDTDDKRFVLHLARFLNPETRRRSVMSVLKPESLIHVNLLFLLSDGRCSAINLAYLFNWVKGDQTIGNIKVTQQFDANIMLRQLLKYFMVISSSVPEELIEEVTEQPEPAEVEETSDLQEDDEHLGASNFTKNIKTIKENVPTQHPDQIPVVKTDEELMTDVNKSLDEDLEILEKKAHYDLHQRGFAIKGKDIVEIEPTKTNFTFEEVNTEIQTSLTPNDALRNKLRISLEKGDLNPASFKKALQDADKYLKMSDPYGSNLSIEERTKIAPEDLKFDMKKVELKDHKTVFDKSMTKSKLQSYTNEYVEKHMHNDVLKMVGAIQKGGIIVNKHEVTYDHSVMGSAELHNLEIKPIDGSTSSIWFRLPVISSDGTFVVGGNKYLQRKQRRDLPIRKIDTSKVQLSSYYGKTFVSTENKVSSSTSAWILKQIEIASFEGSDWIKDVVPGDTFDSYSQVPYIFSLLSTRFISLTAGDIQLKFNSAENIRMPAPRKGMRWCGWVGSDGTSPVWIDQNNQFYSLSDGILNSLGDIFQVLRLNPHDAPVRFSELALFRKNVPVGLILGYRLGWSKLLALVKAEPRKVEPRQRLNLAPDEFPIPFLDGTWVFSRKNALASMIMAGFMDYSKVTKTYELKDFEHPNVYLNLLTSKGLGAIYIREIDMMFDYFVDPITQEILQDMKEPTTFEGLLLRASELLMTYYHPKPQDGAYSRICGYERFPGAVYRQLTQQIRSFRNRNIAGKSRVEMSPWQVWQEINEDQTKMMVPDINPIQDLKNDESVTYVGEGGRSSDAINKASRSFHVSDVGVISEGTVDSSDVGVNIYTSANPRLKNLRGLTDGDDEVTNTNRHCSAVLLAPGATHDD